MNRVVRIALPIPLVRLFDYLPHDLLNKNELPLTGTRVKVPFGRRELVGIVFGYAESSHVPLARLKSIHSVLDQHSLFSAPMWSLLCWAAEYYQHPVGEVLHHALPKLLRQGRSTAQVTQHCWQITERGGITSPLTLIKSPQQKNLLALLQQAPLYTHQLTAQGIHLRVLKTLQKKGLVQLQPQIAGMTHWSSSLNRNPKQPLLNAEQEKVLDAIHGHEHRFGVWLLQGVTGSGKTEVYLRLLENVLAQGRQALVLVPEISLTLQTVTVLKNRLQVPIALLHSTLTDTERLAVWLQARSEEVAVVIGTRSALFTPLKQLGIIIVDEEHDVSYKQQSGWLYQARDLAVFRAREEGIPIVLGSATPALESLYNVQQGKYQHLVLTQRAGGAQPVHHHLLDLKGKPLTAGIAPELLTKMKTHLEAGNQVMLFLNRRGYAPVLLCHDCGWLALCQRCERYYTLHQQQRQLRCHHCGNQRPLMYQCVQCGSTHLLPVGMGTEQLESALNELLPQTAITRIDRDTTRRKGALNKHLTNIRDGNTQLLMGTQMLAKGHHFPNVTLVALLDVDGALFSTDYRAAERFAQLYIQVSGRAGRANKCGEVVLQTHHPQHPLLQILLSKGYEQFSQQTLEERRAAQLPPYTNHALLRAEDLNNQQAPAFLLAVRRLLEVNASNDDALWLLGPIPALQAKRAGYFRWQLLLQHPSRYRLQQLLKTCRPLIDALPLACKIKWSLDIDPMD